eukprot:gb/GEZN01022051.1/.p1 GENE.gb/GEZN01022051.1/~~gb/GEZN01022051.1/.p1  ORF type:complete len:146 (-),score=5.98 gb/GEZN01022051.1/:95-532(-)
MVETIEAPPWVVIVFFCVILAELYKLLLVHGLVEYYTLTKSERQERTALKTKLLSLKHQSNLVNYPATFVQFAKIQRKIIKLTNLQTEIEKKVTAVAWSYPVLFITYGAHNRPVLVGCAMLTCVCLYACCYDRTNRSYYCLTRPT